jgi:hypothetical protein
MGPSAIDRLHKALIFNEGERVSDSSVKLSVTSNVRSKWLIRSARSASRGHCPFCGSALLEGSRPLRIPKQGTFSPAPIERGVSAYRNVVGNPAIST